MPIFVAHCDKKMLFQSYANLSSKSKFWQFFQKYFDVNELWAGKNSFSTYVCYTKPPSVTKNVVGLQIDDAGHVDRNSSADVARVVGLQTDAVVVTETRLNTI